MGPPVSAAATATTATKGVGSSLGGVLDSLGKALNPAQDQVSKVDPAASVRPAAAAPGKSKRAAIEEAAAPAAPPASCQDPMGIEKGMSCEEVIRRFCQAAMAFAGEDDAKMMRDARKNGRVQVECQGGKVASAEKSY